MATYTVDKISYGGNTYNSILSSLQASSKQGLNIGQWNACIPIGQLMSEVCHSEVEENRLNIGK